MSGTIYLLDDGSEPAEGDSPAQSVDGVVGYAGISGATVSWGSIAPMTLAPRRSVPQLELGVSIALLTVRASQPGPDRAPAAAANGAPFGLI